MLMLFCFFTMTAYADYEYKGKKYEYRIRFHSYKVVKNGESVIESNMDSPFTFFISDKGFATIVYGKHEQQLKFSKSECYIQQSLFNTIINNGDSKIHAHIGNNQKYIKIKNDGYASFCYFKDGNNFEVMPIDVLNLSNDGTAIYASIKYKNFMQVEGQSESMVAQAKAIKSFTPIAVNKKNIKGNFSVSGTIRKVIPVESPFRQLRDAAQKWGEVYSGCFNNNYCGALLYGGTGFYSVGDMPMLINRALKVCNEYGHNIADLQMTDEGRYIFLAMEKKSIAKLKRLYLVNNAPDKMVAALENLQNKDDITFYSASLNDKGNWSVTSDQGWGADEKTEKIILKAIELYGPVFSVFMTDNATIVCCLKGIYCENVPSNVYEKLLQIDFQPLVVKFTDLGLYLITEAEKKYVTNL